MNVDISDWTGDPSVAAWLASAPRHQSKVLLEIIAASKQASGVQVTVDKLRQLSQNHYTKELHSMSIPGLDGPVSADEEVFKFTGGTEQPEGERKSKFDFEDGDYPGVVTSITPYSAKESGAPMFLLKMVGTADKARGIDYRKYLPLTGKGVGITERTLKVFGIKPVSKNEDGSPNYEFKASDIIGKPGTMKLVGEEYNGKRRMKLDAVFAPKAAPTTGSDDIPF